MDTLVRHDFSETSRSEQHFRIVLCAPSFAVSLCILCVAVCSCAGFVFRRMCPPDIESYRVLPTPLCPGPTLHSTVTGMPGVVGWFRTAPVSGAGTGSAVSGGSSGAAAASFSLRESAVSAQLHSLPAGSAPLFARLHVALPGHCVSSAFVVSTIRDGYVDRPVRKQALRVCCATAWNGAMLLSYWRCVCMPACMIACSDCAEPGQMCRSRSAARTHHAIRSMPCGARCRP